MRGRSSRVRSSRWYRWEPGRVNPSGAEAVCRSPMWLARTVSDIPSPWHPPSVGGEPAAGAPVSRRCLFWCPAPRLVPSSTPFTCVPGLAGGSPDCNSHCKCCSVSESVDGSAYGMDSVAGRPGTLAAIHDDESFLERQRQSVTHLTSCQSRVVCKFVDRQCSPLRRV